MQEHDDLQSLAICIRCRTTETWEKSLREGRGEVAEFHQESLPVLARSGVRLNGQLMTGYLKRLLGDEDRSIREATAQVLGQIGSSDPAIVKALVNRLDDKSENEFVRREAAHALVEIDASEGDAIEALIDRLDDEDENYWIRITAAEALGKIGTPNRKVIQALINQLGDKNPDIRGVAAVVLGMMGASDSAVFQELTARIGDEGEDYKLRRNAAEALPQNQSAHVGNRVKLREPDNDKPYKRILSLNVFSQRLR